MPPPYQPYLAIALLTPKAGSEILVIATYLPQQQTYQEHQTYKDASHWLHTLLTRTPVFLGEDLQATSSPHHDSFCKPRIELPYIYITSTRRRSTHSFFHPNELAVRPLARAHIKRRTLDPAHHHNHTKHRLHRPQSPISHDTTNRRPQSPYFLHIHIPDHARSTSFHPPDPQTPSYTPTN